MAINQTPIPESLSNACKACVERCTALGLKGIKRDNECVSFLIGVATGFQMAGKVGTGNHIAMVVSMAIATRGYMEVVMLASRPTKPHKEYNDSTKV